ncbi:MAG: tetratricopeptide repeat protein [Deltaproteobacteria bacterium]|nr:tetratricopeptide repeat protein [Deltaproteobacteria bacterium]
MSAWRWGWVVVMLGLAGPAGPAGATPVAPGGTKAGTKAGAKAGAKGKPAPEPAQSKVMQRAVAAFHKGDLQSASIEFHKVTSGETADVPRVVMDAELYQARALTQLGLSSAALMMFDKIITAGPGHAHHGELARWLGELADRSGAESDATYRLATLGPEALDAPGLAAARPRRLLQIARQALDSNDFEGAARSLGQVPGGVPEWGEAQLALATVLFRQGQPERAVPLLETLAQGQPEPLRTRALWNLGVVLDLEQPARAAEVFERIAPGPQWAAAQLAASLARLRAGTGFVGVEVPGLVGLRLDGDPGLLHALIYLDYCRKRAKSRPLLGIAARRGALGKAIAELLQRFADEDGELLRSVRTALGRPPASRPPGTELDHLLAALLTSPRGRAALARVAEVEREDATWKALDPAYRTTQVAAEALEDLTINRVLAEDVAGKWLRGQLERLAEVLPQFQPGKARLGVVEVVAGRPVAPGKTGLRVTAAACRPPVLAP